MDEAGGSEEKRIHIPVLQDTIRQQNEEFRKDFAKKHVESMTPDLRGDLSAWVKLEQALHNGTDSTGKRLDENDRRILNKTLNVYLSKIKRKYGIESDVQLQSFGSRNALPMKEVKDELMKVK